MNSATASLSLDGRIHAYLRASISLGRETAKVGPFLASYDSSSSNLYRNYAIPEDAAEPTAREIDNLISWYVDRSRTPRLEYLMSMSPLVEPALLKHGFTVEARLPLMACNPEKLSEVECPDEVEIVIAEEDATLRAAAGAQNEAYSEGRGASDADVARLKHAVGLGAMVLLARDRQRGEAAGAGLYAAPLDGVTEIAGLGVRPQFRRRGIARALVTRLAQIAFRLGIEIPFLMAATADEERLYARAGFVTCSQMLHISQQEK
jgi:GNAT superfamily N-acetyltransferase